MIRDNFKLHGNFNITDIHDKLKNVDAKIDELKVQKQ